MEKKFFVMYQEIKYNEYYYCHYLVRSTRIQNSIKIILAIATSAGILSWIISNQVKFLWIILIGASQIILAIEHLLPFSKQITTINFFMPDIKDLTCKIDYEFDSIDEMPLSEASKIIYDFHLSYNKLEQKYIGDAFFPYSIICKKKAEKDCDAFFKFRYDV